MSQSSRRRLLSQMAADAGQLAAEWDGRDFGDVAAQAAACAAPMLAAAAHWSVAAHVWLAGQLAPWERLALERAIVLSTQYSVLSTEYAGGEGQPQQSRSIAVSPAHLYDAFLHVHSRGQRKHRSVFFTPQPIADYIVRQVDQTLRTDFNFAGGLAQSAFRNPQTAIALLDPACGTGVFLLAVLEFLHARLADRWNQFVPELLPRLVGIEILPAAAFLAKLNIALKLAETGYDFRQNGVLQIHCGDALHPNLHFAICNSQFAIPIVLGNPPFSSLSTNTNPWIARLVRGDDRVRGYVRADGQRLLERKTWLHDDYVKFIRLAQWHVEEAGCGIVGFVTNHGYLDNATFRLMRQELLRVFPRIRIVDLHGSRKAHEVAPDGGADENVFGLDQGVAISILSRPPTPTRSASEGPPVVRVSHSDLWGTREAKLSELASGGRESPEATALEPQSPGFLFTRAPRYISHPEYAAAWSLADAMPLNATAPVTARDHFVVAFTEEELRQRIEEFRDLAIPENEIRRRYFQRTRSARYETGDTRGWKLSAARAAVAADCDWQGKIVRCLYRPFDWRYVFWHPAMIDWPRRDVTRHLIAGRGSKFKVQSSKLGESTWNLKPGTWNLCLIARRQQLPSQPCTFFWIADRLALDGVIRSDNRGSESLFPLYVEEAGGWQSNFAPEFVAGVTQATRQQWLSKGRGDLSRTFGPEDLLAYIYALFHVPSYRQKYAAELRTGFPRVLLPQDARQFAELSRPGHELIDLHLLRGPVEPSEPVQESALAFRAGGYVALRKWLQPAHRNTRDPQYVQIAGAIARTQEIMAQLEGMPIPASPGG